jgi:hypothetical protein
MIVFLEEKELSKEHPKGYCLYKKYDLLRSLYIDVGNSSYLIEKINFYDKKGVKYSMKHFEFYKKNKPDPRIQAVLFPEKIKRKRQPDFSCNHPFIISLGRCRWDGLKCELFIPVSYLEDLGYEIKERKEETRYIKYFDRWVETEYFDIPIQSQRIDKTHQRLDDLIQSVESLPTENKEVFENALKEALRSIDIFC